LVEQTFMFLALRFELFLPSQVDGGFFAAAPIAAEYPTDNDADN